MRRGHKFGFESGFIAPENVTFLMSGLVTRGLESLAVREKAFLFDCHQTYEKAQRRPRTVNNCIDWRPTYAPKSPFSWAINQILSCYLRYHLRNLS